MQNPLSFLVAGNGPPLVILHGLFGSAANWRRIAQALSGHWQVFTPNLPNHGNSPWVEDMSYPAQAQAVTQFITEHALDHPVLMGHSMGGKTAMALALAGKIEPRALIIADIAPVDYAHSHQSLVQSLRALPLATLSNRQQADQALATDIPDRTLRQFLLQNLVLRDGELRWRLNLKVINDQMELLTGFPPLPGSFNGPTLFIHGECSDYVTPAHTQAISVRFPRARLQSIANAGHWLHAEQTDAFVSAIEHFLKG